MITRDANGWMFEKSHFTDEGRQIAAAMQIGTLLVVTDGSYMKELSTKHAAAAWVIECPRTEAQCHGVIPVPGEERDINPYRAELIGLIAVWKGLEFIAKRWQVTDATVALRVDNRGAGFTACQVRRRISQMNKHVDLICEMRHINSTSPIKVTFEHVYGHQDKDAAFDDLLRPAQLNAICDWEAKSYLLDLISNEAPAPPWRSEHTWGFWIRGKLQTSDVGSAIRQALVYNKLRTHLHNQEKLHEDLFDTVAWEAMGSAISTKPQLFQLWVTKHVSGFCATGKMMKKFCYQAHKTCPCCKLMGVVEDTAHVLICPDIRIRTACSTKIAELKEQINDTAGRYIQEAIQALIRRMKGYPQDHPQDYQQ